MLRVLAIATLGWLLCSLPAFAQPGVSRDALPALEVERGLVLPRGWVEASLTSQRGRLSGLFTPLGTVIDAPVDMVQWVHQWELRAGILPSVEVFGRLPVCTRRIDELEGGLGDTGFGVRLGLFEREPPRTSVMVEVGVHGGSAAKALVGNEAFRAVALQTGTPRLDMVLAAKQSLGPWSMEGSAARRAWFAQESPVGRLEPASLLELSLWSSLQGGPVVMRVGPEQHWTTREGGVTGSLTRVRARMGVHASRGFEVESGWDWAVLGRSEDRANGSPWVLQRMHRWVLSITVRG